MSGASNDTTNPYAASAPLLVARGWSPITIPYGKKDAPLEGYTGAKGVYVDAAQVERWCHPKVGPKNVAVRVPHTIIGLDVDDYGDKVGGKTYADLRAKCGELPPTWRSTARPDAGVSGIYLFAVPDGTRLVTALPGIEMVQWWDRYVMWAPSVNPDAGGATYGLYDWTGYDVSADPPCVGDIPALPEAWLEELKQAPPGANAHRARTAGPMEGWALAVKAKYGEIRLRTDNGEAHHDVVTASATALVRFETFDLDGADDMIERVHVWFVDEITHPRAEGKRVVSVAEAESEWDRIITSARQLVADTPNVDPFAAYEPGAAQPNGQPTTTPPTKDKPSLLGGVRNGVWLEAQTFDPLRYAVPGLFAEGLVLNVGPPKVGKSWQVDDLALRLALGDKAFGHIDLGKARPVFVLALEDSDRRMQDRCRKLLDGKYNIPALFDYITMVELQGPVLDTITAWLDLHGDEQPVVFLDTLGKVMPPSLPGESAYQRDYRIGSALKRLADEHPGSVVFVNHHDRKAFSDDFVETVSGTNGLAGAADTIAVLCRKRNESTGLIKVTGRDVAEGEYALHFRDGMFWELDGDDLFEASSTADARNATKGLGDRAADVYALVCQHPEGITPKAVEEALGMSDARTYLGRLFDADRIRRLSRGVYAPVGAPTDPSAEKIDPLDEMIRAGRRRSGAT